jgi:hypothetical protein
MPAPGILLSLLPRPLPATTAFHPCLIPPWLSAPGRHELVLNVMNRTGKFDLDPEMRVVVSITMAGEQPGQARFTPLRKATASQ